MKPATENERTCPAGGNFGEDFAAYGLTCSECELRSQCEERHKEICERFRKSARGPLWLTIPAGLFDDPELSNLERMIIALIAYRCRGRDRCGYDKNVSIATLFGVSESYVSQILGPKHTRSLVRRGYIVSKTQRLRTKPKNASRDYRTSRKLFLGIRAVRLLNRTVSDTQAPYTVPE